MTAEHRVHGVLFDKDGTLIDCDATWIPVIHHLARDVFGFEGREVEARADAAGLDAAAGRLRLGSVWAAGNTLELVDLWRPGSDPEERLRLALEADRMCASLGPKTAVPLIDIKALFAELRGQGLKVGVATNDSTVSANAFLDAHGLSEGVDFVTGYDGVANAKPAGDMVRAFAADAGIDCEGVAVVGDNRHDLEMSRAGGAGWAIGVLSGNAGLDDLSDLADLVLDNADGVPSWARRQNGVSRHVL